MRPLKPLLPDSQRPRISPPPPPRRDRVPSACVQCRARKTKCNGERPTCLECVKRSTRCHYVGLLSETQGQAIKRRHDEIQVEIEEYAELFKIIKTSPENESHEVMRRIKLGASVGSVLRHIKEADLLIQLTVIPETRHRHTIPYSASMPAFLLIPNNEYLKSPIYQAPFEQAEVPFTSAMDRYMKPNHAAELVEPLLDLVCARDWTDIITDDGLFRRLLTLCLFHQHTAFYWFNKTLFLEDMAARRTSFCSKVLVHAVLAAGCVSHGGN